MLNEARLRQGLVKMFEALKRAEAARNTSPSAAQKKAFFGYPVERLKREYPEIDFVMPFSCYPKKRGQMLRSLISWYRLLRRNDEIETICRAGQSAMVMAQSGFSLSVSLQDVEYIQKAFDEKAKLDGEAVRRVLLPKRPIEFSPKEQHIFLFDILHQHFPTWGSKRICTFADEACLCGSQWHDDRMLRKQRSKWNKAREDARRFKTNPPEFVRRFIEHEDLQRQESEALTVARAKNSKIRGIVKDREEFQNMEKKGHNMKGIMILMGDES